jgi:hypothetical protein
MADHSIADRLLSVMTQARQNEISWIMRRDVKIDPLEIPEIEQRFIDLVKSIKSPSMSASIPLGSSVQAP